MLTQPDENKRILICRNTNQWLLVIGRDAYQKSEHIPQSRYLPGDESVRESIIQASGKRGLPSDISPELLEYFTYRWKKEDVFGKSWMTVDEITEHNEDDNDFYLNEEWFTQYSDPGKVRIIFWFVNFSENEQ